MMEPLADVPIFRNNRRKTARLIVLAAVLFFVLCSSNSVAAEDALVIVDFSRLDDIEAGEKFLRISQEKGWKSPVGEPRYFSISGGRLHLVSKPGPVYEKRYTMALFQRAKLIDSIENKVMLRLTGDNFRLDPKRWKQLCFTMAPVDLPAAESDLRDSEKNDSAFYLITSFDSIRHQLGGYSIPLSIGYVWANRKWEDEVGKDPDYSDFLRYIAIGRGRVEQRDLLHFCRNVEEDFGKVYPDYDTVPELIEISLMIDSNTLGGTAESMVGKIWFETK